MNHLIQANNTASPPDGRPHSLRHRAHSQPGARLTQRKAAGGKRPGVKMQEISPADRGHRGAAGAEAARRPARRQSAPADRHNNWPGSAAYGGQPRQAGRRRPADRGRQRRHAAAPPLVASDGAGDLRRPALRNIQRQTDIALRAAHRQAAHQSIRVRQRLLMLKGKTNTVRKNITQLSRLSASIPSAR